MDGNIAIVNLMLILHFDQLQIIKTALHVTQTKILFLTGISKQTIQISVITSCELIF